MIDIGSTILSNPLVKELAELIVNVTSFINSVVLSPWVNTPGIGFPAGPCRYEVDVNGENWTEASLSSSGVIVLAGSNTYGPVDSEKTELKLTTKEGLFGGVKPVSFSKEITVGKKDDPKPKPQKTGNSYGDPHMITFDGFKYSFQTVGEFTLVIPFHFKCDTHS